MVASPTNNYYKKIKKHYNSWIIHLSFSCFSKNEKNKKKLAKQKQTDPFVGGDIGFCAAFSFFFSPFLSFFVSLCHWGFGWRICIKRLSSVETLPTPRWIDILFRQNLTSSPAKSPHNHPRSVAFEQTSPNWNALRSDEQWIIIIIWMIIIKLIID